MIPNSDSRSTGTGPGSPPVPTYSAATKWLHWLIVPLIATQFMISLLMPDIGPNTVPGTLVNLHLSFGVLILAVMALRLVLRLLYPVPLDLPDSPAWQRWVAQATHLALYFIVMVGPFLGWASASAHKLPVTLFGIIALPDIAAPRARWALTAGDVHGTMMWVLLALIALHAVAALYHHFFLRDHVLRRMLPASSK